MVPLVERYTNKRVSFRFSGASIAIDLSQGLFSSFDIDTGTKFMLTVVWKHIDPDRIERIADIGCGTGAIGIALLAATGGSTCVFQDRDALALAFAESNCRLNGLAERSRFAGGLGMQALPGGFDLILSNLPAKAGLPVLSRLTSEMSSQLAPQGVGAVVIVSPLADALEEILSQHGVEVFCTEDRKTHRVYLFRQGELAGVNKAAGGAAVPAVAGAQGDDYLEPYVRTRQRFSQGNIFYELDTAYNLPEFDTLGHETLLAMELIDRRLDGRFVEDAEGSVLIWNPGQGHPAAYLLRRFPGLSPERMVLASRDALSLEITCRNIRQFQGAAGEGTAPPGRGTAPVVRQVPSLGALGGETISSQVSLALLFPQPVPGAHWEEEAALMLSDCLAPGAAVIACASSGEIHRFLSAVRGLVLHGSRKYHGSRGVILKKSE